MRHRRVARRPQVIFTRAVRLAIEAAYRQGWTLGFTAGAATGFVAAAILFVLFHLIRRGD